MDNCTFKRILDLNDINDKIKEKLIKMRIIPPQNYEL